MERRTLPERQGPRNAPPVAEIRRLPQPGHAADCPGPGLDARATVITMQGCKPASALVPGDRLVTWSGSRVLKDLALSRDRAPLIRIARAGLFPGQMSEVLVPEDQRVLVLHPQVMVYFGFAAGLARAGDLLGLPGVEPVAGPLAAAGPMRIALSFETAGELINAEGLWLQSCRCGAPGHRGPAGPEPWLSRDEVRLVLMPER